MIEISTNRLYVHNLSWRVSWQDLKDHFRQAGEVIHTKILTEGPGGRSKGCGIVEMASIDEAARAVEMLAAYEAPELDPATDEALRAFIAKRMEELPDSEF